jgi:hypothetical protein
VSRRTTVTCDCCGKTLDNDGDRLSFNTGRDLCVFCVGRLLKVALGQVVLTADCKACKGTGKRSVRDDDATRAQACCGENRTQYKTVKCEECFGCLMPARY